MALKPIFNLYYLAPQLVMTISFSSMSMLINQYSLNRKFFLIDKFQIFSISFSIIIFIFGYLFIQPTAIEAFPTSNQIPRNSIVWADSIGSKLNYYYNINTAKLNFGSQEAQRDIIKFLYENNIDQFVLDEDNLASNFKNVSSGSLMEFSMFQDTRLFKYIPK